MANPADSPEPPASDEEPGNAPIKRDAGRLAWLLEALKRRAKIVTAVVLLLPFVVFALDRAVHAQSVLRGVSISGTSFSGLSRAEAETRAQSLADRLRAAPLVIAIRDKRFEVKPEVIGFDVDVPKTVEIAMNAGRSGGPAAGFGFWIARWASSAELSAAIALDTARVESALDGWESESLTDRPFSGGVVVEGTTARADSPREGFVIDRARAIEVIRAALALPGRAPVELPIVKKAPFVAAGAVEIAVERAKKILSGDVTLVADETKVSVTFTRDDLARAFRSRAPTEPDPQVKLAFEPDRVNEKLAALRAEIERPPENARLVVDARDHLSVVPSRTGTLLRAERVADALLEAASSPARVGPLPVLVGAQPERTTADVEALKITGLVSQYTTHHVCCQTRVENIHRAADLLDGRLVKPGEIVSLNVELGPRTPKNGFKPAPTIEEGEMVDALGGGASQFATTFFNAVFLGGYDIIERVPHTYYFSRYPMARDATLSWPKPDVIFENDSQAGMLIRTVYTDTSITVKVYGDNGGRKVSFVVSPQSDAQKPGIEYIPDFSQSPDRDKVKEGGQIGWTVYVTREIKFADGTKKEEKRKVVYKPRVRRVIVHPCRVPQGEPGYTGEPCPEREGGVEGGTE